MTQEERKEMLVLMQEAISPMLEPIHTELTSISNRLSGVEMKIENETDRAVQAIAEGHSILNQKLNEKVTLESRVDALEHEVAAIKYKLKQA